MMQFPNGSGDRSAIYHIFSTINNAPNTDTDSWYDAEVRN